MQTLAKNLKKTAQGASCSTVRDRNSAPVSKKSLPTQPPQPDVQRPKTALQELSDAITRSTLLSHESSHPTSTPYSALKAAEPKKRTWRISLNCVAASATTNIRTVGIYHTDLYEAASQDEAVGIAVQMVSRRFPCFEVDLRSVKCSTLNPVIS